ncbi:MAG: cation:proton antiporter [Verrucomicrobia bacterium]|nr:cation:proton antiporter [Verrucomicrobiota bacterium]
MNSFLLNLLLALVWLLLSDRPSASALAVGYALGFVLIVAFRPLLGSQVYVRRCLGLVAFLARFVREFLWANLKVALLVLGRSRASLHPNFLTYDVSDLKPTEILILSYCISLTPGTTTVQVSADFRTLILHAIDAGNPAAIRAEIDRTLKLPLLRFTR